MKGSILAVTAAIFGVASAQFSGVPNCAQPCLSSAISGVGCPITDVGCQCSSTAQIAQSAAGCILGACTAPGDLQQAITGGGALCVQYSATALTGSVTTAALTEATTTLQSTVQSTSVVTVSATSSTAASVSTVTPVTSDIPSPTPTTPAVIGTGGVTTTRSAGASSSTVQVPVGAAGRNAASMGAFVGFLGALLAL